MKKITVDIGFGKFRIKIKETNYLLILATLVGLAVGIVVIIFRMLLHHAYIWLFTGGSEFLGFPRWITTPLLPAFGGFLVGFLVYRVFKQHGAHGVPSVMKAVATRKFLLNPKMAIKSYLSILTIGFGGSAGPEGPVVEIGSVIGEAIGRKARISQKRYGLLIGCGSAAGIAAIFNAPIGGVFFALEIILRDFAIKAFSPVVISAVVATILSKAWFGDTPAFVIRKTIEKMKIVSFPEVFFFLILGLICAGLAILFIRTLYIIQDIFKKAKIPDFLRPVIGGLMVGMIGYFAPEILGEGYHGMTRMLDGHVAIHALLLWMVFKLLATSLTLGSGGTGGTFAPALFIGAAAGGAVGTFLSAYAPSYVCHDAPILYALAGMAGVIAGTLNAPLTAMLMIFEITGGNYDVVFPLMITVAVSSLVVKSALNSSIYTLGLLREGFDIDHASIPNPLQNILVSSVMHKPSIIISETETLPEILQTAHESDEIIFPVENDNGKFAGIISLNDLRSVLAIGEMGNLLTAKDIADPYPRTLRPEDSLEEAFDILSANELEAIPVVDPLKRDKLLGVIKRQDIFEVYKSLAEGKSQKYESGEESGSFE